MTLLEDIQKRLEDLNVSKPDVEAVMALVEEYGNDRFDRGYGEAEFADRF